MELQSFSEISSEIASKKIEAEKKRFVGGSMGEIEELLKDIYGKLENINERLNKLEIIK